MSDRKPDRRFYVNDLIPVHLLRTERPFEFSKVLAPDSRYVYLIEGYGLDDTLQEIYQRVGLSVDQEDDNSVDLNLICAAMETDLVHFRKQKKETGLTPISEIVKIAEELSSSECWWQIPWEVIDRFQLSKKEEKAQIKEKHWADVFTWEEWEKVLSIISCDKREDPVLDSILYMKTDEFQNLLLERARTRVPRLFVSKSEPATKGVNS
jgi:hypothetical protein